MDQEDATYQDKEDATYMDQEDATYLDKEDATYMDQEDATYQDPDHLDLFDKRPRCCKDLDCHVDKDYLVPVYGPCDRTYNKYISF